MTESYRAHYLFTSLAVVKRTCLTMTDMWVQVPVLQSSRRGLSSRGKLSRSIPLQEICGHIQQLKFDRQKREETISKRKQSVSFLCNNCNKLQYHLPTCNMQICIELNCHVLITTRFICTNPIKCDVYLLYFICINNHVISMQLTCNMLYEHLVIPCFNNDFISMQ